MALRDVQHDSVFFFSSRRRHTRCSRDWSSDVCSSDLGFWTVPAGFMENGETLQAAAARECYEEALAKVEVGSLLAVVSVTGANQVHVMFRAKLLQPEFAPGPESLEVGLYEEAEIPWSQLAFPSGEFTLRKSFEDRSAGREDHHFVELSRRLKS